ncbi:MAG: hypothetical protein MUO34_00900 [Ignavibacteriaceae bacterium]|nr:hypothetical protein [Ignavibacteriaceae bacterium]
MQPSEISLLLQHMKWADAEVWKKVLRLPASDEDERIKKLFYHLHQVQCAFYYIWNDQPLDIVKLEEFTDLKSIAKWGLDYQTKLDAFLASSQSNDVKKIIDIPWSKFLERRIGRKIVPATLEETMLQVTSHSTYHRAQINARFHELGGEPPMVDFIAWVWFGKPATEWNFA